MEVKINISDRTLGFKSKAHPQPINGKGLDSFLEFIQKYGKMIDRVDLSGRSPSFTFTRQVFLAVNLLSVFSGCKLYREGNYNERGELLLPDYCSN